jgi:hypothetical protein
MQLRPANQIPCLIKAMNDVVLPAIDPANTLAQEQARLVVANLGILLQRLPLEYRYDRDELERTLELSGRLRGQVRGSGETAAALECLGAAAARGAGVLERAGADPAELQESVRALRNAVGALIQATFAQGDAGNCRTLRGLVQEASREQLLRERSWLALYGFEPDPKLIPPIESLLAPAGAGKTQVG